MGYPGVYAQPIGENFIVSPFNGFGRTVKEYKSPDPVNEYVEVFVEYRPGADVDPHGLSGSGIWYSESCGGVWSPNLGLAGVVTAYNADDNQLIGYKVETLVGFFVNLEQQSLI